MAQATNIEWTDVSWGPVHGCSKVSPGCAHCYAETLSLRWWHTTRPWTPANAAENVMLKPHKLREPLSKAKPWDKPCMVFVNSMSDLFHELVPFDYIDLVFATMAEAEQHTFQVLTKRPERMLAYFERAADYMGLVLADLVPWPNVWLGVSIENRRFVGRADVLRETPAAVRFISAEPLLGPLVAPTVDVEVCEVDGRTYPASQVSGTVDRAWIEPRRDWAHGDDLDLSGIDWVIVGGESGPGHRPMRLEWARDLRDACVREGLRREDDSSAARLPDARPGPALFVKQLGGARPGTALEDLPEDLRFREFPARVTA